MTTAPTAVDVPAHVPDTHADTIATIMNHGWLALGMSIGEQLGLFEIAADGTYRTAAELAELASVDERYFSEWAWAVAAGGLLEVEGKAGEDARFRVPPALVPGLTKAGGPEHWSRITTQITALAQLEGPLLNAMRTGEGLRGELYEGHIVDVVAGESAPIFERALVDEVLPALGVEQPLANGIRVLDVGCGTGNALAQLATIYPNSSFLGVDQSPDSVRIARDAVTGLSNVEFRVMDIEHGLPSEEFDLIMAANVVHDLSNPQVFFRHALDALRPGGQLYLHELSASESMEDNIRNPHAVGILMFSLFHCLPLARRRPGIAPGGMWGRERYIAALRDAGFSTVWLFNAPSDPNNDTIFAKA